MNKILWIVTVIIILGIGYLILQNYSNSNEEIYLNNKKDVSETESVSIASVTKKIVGDWQSVDDVKSTKIFRKDREVEDVYNGKMMSTGVWKIIDSAKISDGVTTNGIFLETVMDKEKYLYKVISVNETELKLTYLPRGNTLSYKKIINN